MSSFRRTRPLRTASLSLARSLRKPFKTRWRIARFRLLLQDLRLSRLEGAEKPKKDPSSLRLTILGGIGTLILATANNFSNWYSNLSLEESKLTRELIKTVFNEDQNPQVRRDNFLFLLEAGLVPDNDGRIRKTLKALPLDKTPSFAVGASNAGLLSKRVGGGIYRT